MTIEMEPQVISARIHAILAIHNRRELTLRSLQRCSAAAELAGAEIHFTIFDDGSTDGSEQEITAAFPRNATVIRGDGTAYWALGMSIAERHALGDPVADFLLWLNDDVELLPSALGKLLQQAGRNPGAIIVGAMRTPGTEEVSYSGYLRRDRWNPLRLAMVEEVAKPMRLDAFHGNCVLVPAATARRIGGIDGGFTHGWADIDYGFKANAAGIEVILAPGFVGDCQPNRVRFSGANTWSQWQSYLSIKGAGNLISLRRILRRHAGRRWPLLITQSYFLWWVRAALHILGIRDRTDS